MRNWKQIQKLLAEEYGLPLYVVEQHTRDYWKHVRMSLANPVKDQFYIPGLGRFKVTPKRLFKLLAGYIITLRRGALKMIPVAARESSMKEARKQFPVIWKLKQTLGWHNTSKKAAPREFVQKLSLTRPVYNDNDVTHDNDLSTERD